MKRCWTEIESYFPLHRVRKWYFRHSGIPIFLLKLKMCGEESEVQIIHRVLADRWRASELTFRHPYGSLWPPQCWEIWKRCSVLPALNMSWICIDPLWLAASIQMQQIKHFPFISKCFPLFKQLSVTLQHQLWEVFCVGFWRIICND